MGPTQGERCAHPELVVEPTADQAARHPSYVKLEEGVLGLACERVAPQGAARVLDVDELARRKVESLVDRQPQAQDPRDEPCALHHHGSTHLRRDNGVENECLARSRLAREELPALELRRFQSDLGARGGRRAAHQTGVTVPAAAGVASWDTLPKKSVQDGLARPYVEIAPPVQEPRSARLLDAHRLSTSR